MKETSWEPVGDWYDKAVGAKGHYYHQNVILPNALRLLDAGAGSKVLDLGCGQGVLSRHLSAKAEYVGIDLSASLIRMAKEYKPAPSRRFLVGDAAAKKLPLEENDFTHGAILLALQNIEEPLAVFHNFHRHMKNGGKLLIVLNHPCYRIPRQSSWGVDAPKKLQYRRVDRYFSPLKIPIQMHPGQKEPAEETWSFHFPLSSYSRWLKEAGFAIELIEEWCSDKKSTGAMARMEDRSRQEFPLFLTLLASK